MANNIIKRVWNQGSMTPIEDLQGSAFTNENGGHTFQISGVDSNGEALALSGTVAASFLRPDQTTVVISGSVSGGVASVTLSEECYGIPGRFGLVVFLTSDGKKTAIYSCVGNVARSSTDAVAPGVAADVVDLINEIETAVGTIPASYSALMADIAPTYSSTALYAVGDYAWYEGDLKRCIVPIAAGETYTPAHWTSAVVGDDVSALKSAISGYKKTFTYTGADTKYFDLYLAIGQSYKIENHLGAQMAFKVKDGSGTTTTIATIKNGSSFTFTPTYEYFSIGGYSSSSGYFTVESIGYLNYAENQFYGEPITIENGSLTSTSQPPVLTTSTTRLRPDRFIRVKAGQTVKITNGSFRHNFFGWYGTNPNTATKTIADGVSDTDATYYFKQDGFFSVMFFKNPESTVLPSAFDGKIEIGILQSETIRVMSYNTGGFEGAGYTQGSDELGLQYRKAVGETNANLCIVQEDLAFFNSTDRSNPKDVIFPMYRYNTRNGGTNYNYKCFASDYPVRNRVMVDYTTPNVNHTYFLVGEIVLNGTVVTIVNLHLDWYDVTRRQAQIAEIISYLSGKKHVIVAGDMNPSTRINGDFPEGASHTENYDNWAEDNALWTDAGYTVGNGGNFGAFQTDMTYPAPTETDCAAWDNIIVSSDIKIKNVGRTLYPYMNDHAIFWADLQFELIV